LAQHRHFWAQSICDGPSFQQHSHWETWTLSFHTLMGHLSLKRYIGLENNSPVNSEWGSRLRSLLSNLILHSLFERSLTLLYIVGAVPQHDFTHPINSTDFRFFPLSPLPPRPPPSQASYPASDPLILPHFQDLYTRSQARHR